MTSTPWSAPRLWPGRTFVILASGPSLTDQDIETVHTAHRAGRVIAIAVNSTFRKAPWSDLIYGCDAKWWIHNPDAVASPGLKVSIEADVPPGVRHLCYREPRITGLDLDPGYLATGNNSGYQAINLACHLGAARILLQGFDCGVDPAGNLHWHGDHPAPLRNPDETLFAKWRQAFDTLPPALAAIGVEVINCSRETTLTCFPRADIKTSLRSI